MQEVNTHISNIRSLKTGILSISKKTLLRDSDANISPFHSLKTRLLNISKSKFLLIFEYFAAWKRDFWEVLIDLFAAHIRNFESWKLDSGASSNRPSSRVAQPISVLLAVSKRNSFTLPNRSLCMTSILIYEYFQSFISKSNSFHLITVHI